MKTIGIAIVTLVLLVGGTAAVAAQEDEAVPAGEPAVYLTGTFELLPPELPDPVMNPETGVLEVRDGRLEFITEAGDPRTEGPYAVEPLNMDIDPTTGVGRMWGSGHIENDAGAWDGTVRGLHYPVAEGVDGYTAMGVLTGSGAYEGLTYSYRASFDGEDAFVEAIIYEGEPAPVE